MDIPRPKKTAPAAVPSKWQHFVWALGPLSIVALTGCIALAGILLIPPREFPVNELVIVPEDASSVAIGSALKEAHAVNSSFLFQVLTRVTGQHRTLESGMYVFDRPMGLAEVAWRISHGRHGISAVRVTLTEGMTVDDMARTLDAAVAGFDTDTFRSLASTSEGYLFPDTYFIYPGTTADKVFLQLRERFDERIATLAGGIEEFGEPLGDIVTMASILEREAQSKEDMQMVAGILWKRLADDMPLQVDAAFGYARGRNGYTPTAEDLDSDSPYNTYRNKGLPPTPIANPGMNALEAAITPADNPYYYYLTGNDGRMYYARTFEGHKDNKAKYLK